MRRAVRGFYCKLGVGAFLKGGEGDMSKLSRTPIIYTTVSVLIFLPSPHMCFITALNDDCLFIIYIFCFGGLLFVFLCLFGDQGLCSFPCLETIVCAPFPVWSLLFVFFTLFGIYFVVFHSLC